MDLSSYALATTPSRLLILQTRPLNPPSKAILSLSLPSLLAPTTLFSSLPATVAKLGFGTSPPSNVCVLGRDTKDP
ncbi:hypothetical protein CsSME_00002229 [Camellia sinensis var. sinensis]